MRVVTGKPIRWGVGYADGTVKYWMSRRDAEFAHFKLNYPGAGIHVVALVEVKSRPPRRRGGRG